MRMMYVGSLLNSFVINDVYTSDRDKYSWSRRSRIAFPPGFVASVVKLGNGRSRLDPEAIAPRLFKGYNYALECALPSGCYGVHPIRFHSIRSK